MYFFKCEISGFLHLTILKENTDVKVNEETDGEELDKSDEQHYKKPSFMKKLRTNIEKMFVTSDDEDDTEFN